MTWQGYAIWGSTCFCTLFMYRFVEPATWRLPRCYGSRLWFHSPQLMFVHVVVLDWVWPWKIPGQMYTLFAFLIVGEFWSFWCNDRISMSCCCRSRCLINMNSSNSKDCLRRSLFPRKLLLAFRLPTLWRESASRYPRDCLTSLPHLWIRPDTYVYPYPRGRKNEVYMLKTGTRKEPSNCMG